MNNRSDTPDGVFGSLSAEVRRLRQNPVIFVGAFIMTILGGVVALLGFIHPVLANVGSLLWLVIWSFLIGGFLGMVLEAKRGGTTLGTLISAGKSNYSSMLGATVLFAVLLVGIVFLLSVLTFVLFIVVIFGAATVEMLEGGLSLVLVAVGVLFVMLLPYFLVYVFLQFYDTAIVADNERAIPALKRSFTVVRRNFLGVVGYTIVFFLIQTIGYGPGYAMMFFGGVELTETGEWVILSESLFVLGSLLTLVLGTLAMAVAFTYHLMFYESIQAESDDEESSGNTPPTDGR